MKAISLFNGSGNFSIEKCIELSTPFINLAKEDRTILSRFSIPKYFLSEIYCYLKKKKDLPELSQERKKEIWIESGKDRLLAYSLYLVEVL